MKMRAFVLAAVAAISISAPANAQSSKVKFGMTPEEAVAVSAGQLSIVEENPDTRIKGHHKLVGGTIDTGNTVMEISLYFDPQSKRMRFRETRTDPTLCSALRDNGDENFGTEGVTTRKPLPSIGEGIVLTETTWETANGDLILVEVTRDDTTVMCKLMHYAPDFTG